MTKCSPISRRNLFRRSFGLRTREDEDEPKEPLQSTAPHEDIIPDPTVVKDTAPQKVEITVNDPAERLRRLLEEEPGYVDIYRMVLEYCLEEHSMPEIEYLLRAHPALTNPKVYPSYLVDRLEFVGALEWTGKWRTTETGRETP